MRIRVPDGRGEAEHGPPTHRLPDKRGPLDAQVIKQLAQILDEPVRPRSVVLIARIAKPAMVDRHAAIMT